MVKSGLVAVGQTGGGKEGQLVKSLRHLNTYIYLVLIIKHQHCWSRTYEMVDAQSQGTTFTHA